MDCRHDKKISWVRDKMKTNKIRYGLAVILILSILMSGCVNLGGKSEVKGLDGVDIRDYEGEMLSSINDFRENSISGPQYINVEEYTLEVSGLVENPREYTYEQALDRQKYSKVITLYCVEGWDVKLLWEGILLKELLEEAVVKPEANTVIFHAHDGYSTSFPLEYIIENDILLAHKMNNVTLPPERGFPILRFFSWLVNANVRRWTLRPVVMPSVAPIE